MHRGHDHHHDDGNGAAGAGHNVRPLAIKHAQWQTPHRPHAEPDDHHHEPDLDLVEAAFVESFAGASDPVSFLRLARIPFEATDAAGDKLVMLRVEIEQLTDVGALMPHIGGQTMRYDPLPSRMVAHRRRLRFMYFDGAALRALTLAEVRTLTPAGG